ncbi:DUF2972 domain-containing protein [Campylobacter jejuni]|nr:DUF2972 domain-containing protein [Campylobacter jejuni]EJP8445668.1 DUF2972 domain-containing protein [Campylobacter jejuni]
MEILFFRRQKFPNIINSWTYYKEFEKIYKDK